MSLRRIFGMLILLSAVAGVVLAAAGIWFSFRVRAEFTKPALEHIAAIQDGLNLVHDVTAKARTLLNQAKQKVHTVDGLVRTLADELKQKGSVQSKVLSGVEKELTDICAQAEEWVRSMMQTAETARTTVAIFTALQRGDQDEEAAKRTARLRKAVDLLNETMPYLKDLEKWLGEIREQRDLPKNVDRLGTLLADLDTKLGAVQKEVRDFDQWLAPWRAAVHRLEADFPELM